MSEATKMSVNDMIEKLNTLEHDNEQLRIKLRELEDALNKTYKPISAEELICIEQIALIKTKNRELTLDEVRRLDLLIKNLRLIRDESTENVSNNNGVEFSEEQLKALADALR